MLLPRFTVRLLLVLTTVCAVFFLVVSLALAGQTWAIAVCAAVGVVGVAAVGYALCFFAAWVCALVWSMLRGSAKPQSPFASKDRLPPQYVPPVDPQ